MITKTETKHPGIKKITREDGTVAYRLIIVVGRRADGRYSQECHTFRTLTEAKAKQDEIRNAKRHGTLVKRTSVTFDKLCKLWLDSRHDIRQVSRLGYEYALKPARDILGRYKVQDLGRADIEAVVKAMKEQGRARRTINYTLGTIKQVLEYGIVAGMLHANVAAGVKPPREAHAVAVAKKAKRVVWELDELLQFRSVADTDEWAACWRLTLCGLRRSEIMGLSWSAVALEHGEVKVVAGRVKVGGKATATVTDDPKSSASRRTVPVEQVQPGTIVLLRSLRAHQATDRLALGHGYQETGLVLVDALGAPINPEVYSDRFTSLCHQADVRVPVLHDVRHALAGIMHRNQIAPADAAALLGHTIAVHLDRYVQPSEKGARTAASGLGAAMSGLV